MTVSLTQPMDSDWTQIYLYIAGKVYERWGKHEVPTDIAVDSLNDYQMAELKHFKDWLHIPDQIGRCSGANRPP